MSSPPFEIQLEASRRLRCLLLLTAVVTLLCGVVLILGLPLSPPVRAVLLAGWLLAAGNDLRARCRGAARIRALGIDAAAGVHGYDAAGRRVPLALLGGSVLTPRFAWLRLQFDDGSRYGELLAGDPRQPDWRRLQLVWTQWRDGNGPS